MISLVRVLIFFSYMTETDRSTITVKSPNMILFDSRKLV